MTIRNAQSETLNSWKSSYTLPSFESYGVIIMNICDKKMAVL